MKWKKHDKEEVEKDDEQSIDIIDARNVTNKKQLELLKVRNDDLKQKVLDG